MSEPLYLFVGKSASGKTTIAQILEEQYGHKSVSSYTTRPPRYDGESGHVFISEDEFDQLGKLAAFTNYNGYRYGVTYEQLSQCDIYVIDVPGVKSLINNIYGTRPIVMIYFESAVSTRIDRMIDRGASDMDIIKRLHHDDTTKDWFDDLFDLSKKCKINLHVVDANENIENVLKQVLFYMR